MDDQLCGIEVTELVHERALRLSKRKGEELHFAWERNDFEKELRQRIARKDKPPAVLEISYERYFLVIVTDEMFLDASTVEEFLNELVFETKFITDILFAISYDPSVGKCPVFKLNVHEIL